MATELPAMARSIRWPSRRRDLLLTGLLFAAVLVAYFPARNGGRLLDDDLHITAPSLRSLAGLERIWFEVGATQQYYPVVHTAFWLEHRLWGDAVTGYHLTNVLLHAVAAVLVVLLLRRLRLPGAWLAAFLFALHPVCVESVAWIAEQKNTLSLVFALGAAITYLKFEATRNRLDYGLALGWFVLALLSKTAVVTVPGALLVLAWWRRSRLEWRRDVWPLLPWFLLGGAVSAVTFLVERRLVAGVGENFPLSLAGRVLLAGRAFWFYLAKLFWPSGLTFFYPRWEVNPSIGWQYLYPLAAAAAGVVLWRLARKTRGPFAAFLCFAGALLPVLGFFNVEWFVFSYVADHLQYLAGLAVIIPTAAFLADRAARLPERRRRLALIGAGLGVCGLGLLTWGQCGRYADPETFYRTAIELNPTAAEAHDKLGTVLAATGNRMPEAIAEFDQALRIRPELPGAYYNRGSAYLQVSRLSDALPDFEQAKRQQPDSPDVRTNLGIALARSGRLPEAIEEFQAAHRIEPEAGDTIADLAQARYELSLALIRQHRFAEAAAQLAEALRLRPGYAEARVALRNLSLLEGGMR